jgi:signal transduction histidine kinase
MRSGRIWQGRALVCIGIVILSASILTVLAFFSMHRQREAIRALARANWLFSAENLRKELETRILEQSATALKSARESLRAVSGPTSRRLREETSSKAPFAQLLVARSDSVVVPRLTEAVPDPEPAAPALLWNRAASAPPAEALAIYTRLQQEAPLPAQKARAMARRAATLARLGHVEKANAIFTDLLSRYPDEVDPFGRPFALVSAFELHQAKLVRADFEGGRWDLSAELFDYYRSRFEDAGIVVGDGSIALYSRARSLGKSFRPEPDLAPGQVRFFSDRTTQYAYTPLSPGDFLVGVISPEWMNRDLLPKVVRDVAFPGRAAIVDPASSDSVIRFQSVFPFQGLRLEPDAALDSAISQASVAFGGVVLLAIAALGGSLVAMTRTLRAGADLLQLRTDLVNGVTHDLKTPLTIIRLYADTLSAGMMDESKRRSFAATIARQSQWLTALIDNVLDFSRIESGRKQYYFMAGSVGETVAKAVEIFQPGASGFQVDLCIAEGLPDIPHDPEALSRALLNLLGNAVKYSGDSRWIGVSVSRTETDIRVSVEDRGSGIPLEAQSRIFDRFYRGSGEAGKGGYGLGLFLANHAVQAHGGRIEVESSPGRGSRFDVILPWQKY